MPIVFAPEDLEPRTGASPSYIRQLARENRVPHLRVGRNAIKFTEPQVVALLDFLTREPETPVTSLTTRRSRARKSS